MALLDQDPKDLGPKAPDFSDADSGALLERIMQDLELPPTSVRRRRFYGTFARTCFLAPRAAVAAMAVIAAVLLFWCFAKPPAILSVETQVVGSGAAQQVTFTAEGPLLRTVYARMRGAVLPAERTGGAYTVRATHNGVLTLEVETLLGQSATRSVTVDGVDEEQPHLAGDKMDGGDILIYLTDGDGVGIDWAGITGTLADGTPYPCTAADEAAGCVRFAYPTQTLHLTVPDHNGNLLHATLEPQPQGAADGD